MRGPYDDGDVRSGVIWVKNRGRTVVRPRFFTYLIPIMEEPLLQWLPDPVPEKQVHCDEYRNSPGRRKLRNCQRPQECLNHIQQRITDESKY